MDLSAAFHGLLNFGVEDLVLEWPAKTKKGVREKFAAAVNQAAEAGAKFTLLPERLAGFATTFDIEAELVLLLRDIMFQSGSRNSQSFLRFLTHNKLFGHDLVFRLFLKSFTKPTN